MQMLGKGKTQELSRARREIVKLGKEAVPALLEALSAHRSSVVRRNVALILGEIGCRDAVPCLLKALGDRSHPVRCNAAIALGLIGDKRAVPLLLKKLRSTSWELRLNSAVSLGWINEPKAAEPLLRLLRDENETVRKGAAFALGEMRDPVVRKALLNLLWDEGPPPLEAAVALTFQGDMNGFYFVQGIDSYHYETHVIKSRKNETSPSKLRATEAFDLGNLFYHSQMFPAALSEYQRALAIDSRRPSQGSIAFLNNMGNSFRQIGFLDQSLFFYLLALKLDPERLTVKFNASIAETGIQIQEIIKASIVRFLQSSEGKKLTVPGSVQQFMDSLRDHYLDLHGAGFSQRVQQRVNHLMRIFLCLGYRTMYGFMKFQGKEPYRASGEVPHEFLLEHLQPLADLFLEHQPLLGIYVLVKNLSQELRSVIPSRTRVKKHLPMAEGLAPFPAPSQVAREEEYLADAVLDQFFLYGFLVALIREMWGALHCPLSLN